MISVNIDASKYVNYNAEIGDLSDNFSDSSDDEDHFF